MKTVKFEVIIDLPEGCNPHSSPEIQSGLLREIIQHRAHYLFGNGGGIITVRHVENELNWEHVNAPRQTRAYYPCRVCGADTANQLCAACEAERLTR